MRAKQRGYRLPLLTGVFVKVLSKDARVRSAAEEAVSALLYAHVRSPTAILMLLFGMERTCTTNHYLMGVQYL